MTEHGTPRERDVQIVQALLDSGRDLTKDYMQMRQRMEPRRFRAVVSELRLRGYGVVSESSEGSAYKKARSLAEVEAFVERELLSRARVLETQAREMLDKARIEFGSAEQLVLMRDPITAGRR